MSDSSLKQVLESNIIISVKLQADSQGAGSIQEQIDKVNLLKSALDDLQKPRQITIDIVVPNRSVLSELSSTLNGMRHFSVTGSSAPTNQQWAVGPGGSTSVPSGGSTTSGGIWVPGNAEMEARHKKYLNENTEKITEFRTPEQDLQAITARSRSQERGVESIVTKHYVKPEEGNEPVLTGIKTEDVNIGKQRVADFYRKLTADAAVLPHQVAESVRKFDERLNRSYAEIEQLKAAGWTEFPSKALGRTQEMGGGYSLPYNIRRFGRESVDEPGVYRYLEYNEAASRYSTSKRAPEDMTREALRSFREGAVRSEATDPLRAIQKIERLQGRIAEARARASELATQGYVENQMTAIGREASFRGSSERVPYSVRQFERTLSGAGPGGSDLKEVLTLNEATNTAVSKREPLIRRLTEAEAALRRETEATARANKAATEGRQFVSRMRTQLMGEGNMAMPATVRTDASGRSFEIQNFYKVAHTGLAQYEVTLTRVNGVNQTFTKEVLRGAAASKFLGDSIFRAGEKILVWTTGTTLIFTAIAAIKRFSTEISELAYNTTYMARVSDRLSGSITDSKLAWESRAEAAERMTNRIVAMTAAIGGSALEAQRAATIFLRAGQSEEQTLTSVKAALLAARVAELGVVETAEMLTSALLQFDMQAGQLLPTLDTLNSLSNNYKVTVADLLNSISRAGSVYAFHNGTLSQLAATTTVVSQVTNRSGTEIGNALKTIMSNLDRVDTRTAVLEKLGVSTVELSGESKSLNAILLQLHSTMGRLNELDQKELQLSIAGVRQRNVLNAAINTAVDAIVAQNKALNDGGSAMSEFQQQSVNLKSIMDRLSASFTLISNTASGPVGHLFRTLANNVNAVAHLTSALGVVPIYALTAAGTFTVLSAVLGKLYASFGLTSLAETLHNRQLAATSIYAGVATAATNRLTYSQIAQATATWALTAAHTALNTVVGAISSPLGIATVLVTGFMLATSYAAETATKYTETMDLQSERAAKQAEQYRKQAAAIRDNAAAINELYIQSEMAKESGLSPEKRRSIIDGLLNDAMRIRNASKFNTDLSGGLTRETIGEYNREAIERGLEEDRKRFNKIKEDIEYKQIKLREQQKKFESARTVTTIAGDLNRLDPISGMFRRLSKVTGPEREVLTPEEFARRAEKNELPIRLVKDFVEARKEVEATEDAIKSLESELNLVFGPESSLLQNMNPDQQLRWTRALGDAVVSVQALSKKSDHNKTIERAFGLDFGGNSYFTLLTQFKDLAKAANEAESKMRESLSLGDTGQLRDKAKQVNQVLSEMIEKESKLFAARQKPQEALYKKYFDLENEFRNREIKTRHEVANTKLPIMEPAEIVSMRAASSVFLDNVESVGRLRDELEDLQIEYSRLADNLSAIDAQHEASEASAGRIASIESQRVKKVAEIRALDERLAKGEISKTTHSKLVGERREDLESLEQYYATLQKQRNEFVQEHGAGPQSDPRHIQEREALADTQARINSLKEEMVRKEEAAADSLNRKAYELYEIEAKIAVERRKSADEAIRALGGLGEEDKLRVLTMAEWARNNPDQNLGPVDMLTMDARNFSLFSQFLPTRISPVGADGKTIQDVLGKDFGGSRVANQLETALRKDLKGDPNSSIQTIVALQVSSLFSEAKKHMLEAAKIKDSGAFGPSATNAANQGRTPPAPPASYPQQQIVNFNADSINLRGAAEEIGKLFDHQMVLHVRRLDEAIQSLNRRLFAEKKDIPVAGVPAHD